MGFGISQDMDNENIIHIEQTWERRSSLDEHLHSEIFRALLGAAKLLGETYNIRINDGSQIEGMQTVEAARLKEDDRKRYERKR